MEKQANDYLISMVKCLHDMRGILKEGTREQLKRMDLISIKAYCASCLTYIKDNYTSDCFKVVADINAVIELCVERIADTKFTETDVDEKQFIVKRIIDSEENLCLLAGKRYTSENRFTFKPTMLSVYNYIVDVCIESGYFFGLEEEIRNEVE